MAESKKKNKTEIIHWSFHPRVFTSLGAELVTNDLVALVELVKNAYDAFARKVDIRFIEDEDTGNQIIEVQDDGNGMDRNTVINSWCMVGTPYKADETSVHKGKKSRRVTGEKGIGRLSAARLGKTLRMYTKKIDEPCYRVDVDWEQMANATSLDKCNVEIRRVRPPDVLGNHGTLLRIRMLNKTWDFDEESELRNLNSELARFVPPFREQTDFRIYLTLPGEEEKPVRVKSSKLLSHPIYILKGRVDERGVLSVEYQFKKEEENRKITGKINLTERNPRLYSNSKFKIKKNAAYTKCGSFDFEFRIWDFDKETLIDLGKRFDLGYKVTVIRKLISDNPFNGISLYRDGIIVLPKEIGAIKKQEIARRDWLGLNLRRVSRVGKRIGANQIIGYVNVSADENSSLRDTADRERLVDNSASRQFRQFLFQIVEFIEHEREKDRLEPEHKEPPLKDLFANLRTPSLPKKITEIEEREGDWEEIHKAVTEHTNELDKAVSEIEQRFYYYSRLASVGSLAMLLQHEVGNKVSVISELTEYVQKNIDELSNLRFLKKRLELAHNAVRSLQRLADIFSPLASRTFGTQRRNSILEEIIEQIAEWHEKEIKRLNIKFKIDSDDTTKVSIDPGELTPIIDNLMTNSLYWLKKVPMDKRIILVEVFSSKDDMRTEVRFHDSGPGVEDEWEEKIFWPG
jgi:signal transduction histidine kinase